MSNELERTAAPPRLAELEAIIERGVADVARALTEIRNERFYTFTHDTFEDYCQDRWGWTARHVGRQIGAAGVIDLLTIGPMGPNIKERQARELIPLRDDPPELRAAFADAQRIAGERGQKVTASVIREAVRSRVGDMAAQSNREMEAAMSGMSSAKRAAYAPDRMAERGALRQHADGLLALGNPQAFAARHEGFILDETKHQVAAALQWLTALSEEIL